MHQSLYTFSASTTSLFSLKGILIVFGYFGGGAFILWLAIILGRDKIKPYEQDLGLRKANLVYGSDYQKVRNLILPTRGSVFSKTEPMIWLYRGDDTEIFLGANRKNDLRVWLQLETVLQSTHIVLDGENNNAIRSNLKKSKLPKQQVQLEGSFSQHFKLYCNPGQQVIALQIIAPDAMAYILDNLINVDIEIIDNQLAIISKNGAKTIEQLQANIKLAQHIDKLAKSATKVTNL